MTQQEVLTLAQAEKMKRIWSQLEVYISSTRRLEQLREGIAITLYMFDEPSGEWNLLSKEARNMWKDWALAILEKYEIKLKTDRVE